MTSIKDIFKIIKEDFIEYFKEDPAYSYTRINSFKDFWEEFSSVFYTGLTALVLFGSAATCDKIERKMNLVKVQRKELEHYTLPSITQEYDFNRNKVLEPSELENMLKVYDIHRKSP